MLEIDLAAAARSDKVVDTVSYDKVVDCASEAFCGATLPPDRGGRRRGRRRRAGGVSRACATVRVTIHKPHAPIAATFDDVGVTLVRHAAMAEALLALGGNVGDSRAILDRADRRCCATARTCG